MRYQPAYEPGGVCGESLREVVVIQGLLADVPVGHEEAVQGPEEMQEAQQGAEDGGRQEEQEPEDEVGHLQQPQPPERPQGDQGDGDDLQGNEDQQPDARGEDTALPGLAVPQVGDRDPVEIIEAVRGGVVTEVGFVVTVGSKVPLPWEDKRGGDYV